MKLFRMVAALGFAVATVPVSAAYVSFNATIAQGTVPYATSFSVSKFDGLLGTLTGIEITLASNTTAQVDVFNTTGVLQSFSSASASLPITVTSNTAGDSTTVTSTAVATVALGTANPGLNSFPGVTGGGTTIFNVNASNWAYYIGLSGQTVSFAANAGSGTFGGTSVPGVFFSGNGLAGADFTIKYDYTPPSAVPLPAAGWLLLTGLGSLGLLSRRTEGSETAT